MSFFAKNAGERVRKPGKGLGVCVPPMSGGDKTSTFMEEMF